MILKTTIATLLALSMSASLAANTAKSKPSSVSTNTEKKITKHYSYNGKDYYLNLITTESIEVDNGEDVDVINLKMNFVNNKNVQLWSMKDRVTCSGLDISADFIPEAITFNAIKPHTGDENNIEVTLGYKMFCGGGVDPKVLKVIYHDNTKKVALRGETAIVYEGEKVKPTDGKYQIDSDFKKAPPQIQNHLKNIWKKVYIENMQ